MDRKIDSIKDEILIPSNTLRTLDNDYQKHDVPPHPKGCGLKKALVLWMHEKYFIDFSAQRITSLSNSLVLKELPHHKWCGYRQVP